MSKQPTAVNPESSTQHMSRANSANDRGAQHGPCTDSSKAQPNEQVMKSRSIQVVTATDLEPIDIVSWARSYSRVVLELYREERRKAA